MARLRTLIESRPYQIRVPDQSLIAARAEDGSYAFVYIPTGQPVAIDLSILSGSTVAAGWYDPREGTFSRLGELAATGARKFMPPSSGRGHDWVLVLDDATK